MTLTEDRPIFQQIAEQLEEAIPLRGLPGGEPGAVHHGVFGAVPDQSRHRPEGDQPAGGRGAAVQETGRGMFVASGAREKLRQSRRERFYQDYVQRMVREARNLGLTDQELLELLERGMKEDGH